MSAERRKMPRQEMHWEAQMLEASGSLIGGCTIVNVSALGAKLVLPTGVDAPDCFVLGLSRHGQVRRQCEVTWRKENNIGVRFLLPAPNEDETISHIGDT